MSTLTEQLTNFMRALDPEKASNLEYRLNKTREATENLILREAIISSSRAIHEACQNNALRPRLQSLLVRAHLGSLIQAIQHHPTYRHYYGFELNQNQAVTKGGLIIDKALLTDSMKILSLEEIRSIVYPQHPK